MFYMFYYETWVRSQRYHSDKPLTYCFSAKLPIGSIVVVPLQNKNVVGIVVNTVNKPSFTTKAIVRAISDAPLPAQLIELISWMKDYYPAPFGQIVSTVIPVALTSKSRQPNPKNPVTNAKATLPPLNDEQASVLGQIRASGQSVMLHGDTGTGKTRVYMELIQESLSQKRSVVLLTPEIGLTPQLANECQELFPGQTVVIHSGLSVAERRNIWMSILEAKLPLIVIGPRSALFTPLNDVGLVIIDECHESTYKQEQAPHYQATRIGAQLAKLHDAQLILGSATPSVDDYYIFSKKNLPILRMTKQAVTNPFGAPKIDVIDLKNKQHFTKSAWLSNTLLKAVQTVINNKQQALVLLNRRGTARLILCQQCGWQALCPRCDLPLTYHGDTHNIQCHTCGYLAKTPTNCPECSANDIIFRNIGTKSIVSEIKRLIPNATIARFDSDTLKPERLEQQYSKLKNGSIDILVGTQMLGKGLDLPNLAVLGIVTAETSLSFPDFTAEERTFQQLAQALGRINRGHTPGTAVIQTYQPRSLLLKAVIDKNYNLFYESQIKERQIYKFPPFRHLLKLTCSRASNASAQRASEQLSNKIKSADFPIEIIGPNPAFINKTHGRYHWQIVIKSVDRHALVEIIHNLPTGWSYDIDPMNLL